MYKVFKTSKNDQPSYVQEIEHWNDGISEDVEEEIDELWEIINAKIHAKFIREQSDISFASFAPTKPKTKHNWNTVRIFISSTFKDFFAEREILVKKVFPELRNLCANSRIQIVDCDLRWGVPKDATGAEAVHTCLEQLDKCLEETNGQSFFLGLLGDRYGWVPNKEDLTDEIIRKYQWTFGSSVTQMEIVHGALVPQSSNALFMIRNGDFYENMPKDVSKDFYETKPNLTAQVKRTKLEITRHFPKNQVKVYNINFAGLKSDGKRQRVVLNHLDEFADQVLKFFKNSISKTFPEVTRLSSASRLQNIEERLEGSQVTSDTIEDVTNDEVHIEHMYLLTKYIVGQKQCLISLQRYVEGMEPSDEDGFSIPQATESTLPCVVVYGNVGCGKSTAMARIASHCIDRGYEVILHFGTISSGSGSQSSIVNKIKQLLESLSVNSDLVSDAIKDPQYKFHNLLQVCRHVNNTVVIVLDGLEDIQIGVFNNFPESLPNNVKIIMSCNKQDVGRCLQSNNPYMYELEPLTKDECWTICEDYLKEFGKRLDKEQQNEFLNKSSIDNPLWVTSACEELRLHGEYSTVSATIRSFPDNIPELFKQIAQRLIMNNDKLKTLLCILTISRHGLYEMHLKALMKHVDSQTNGKEKLSTKHMPTIELLNLLRHLKPFVHSTIRTAQMVTFRHSEAKHACYNLLFHDSKVATHWHQQMADFYSKTDLTGFQLVKQDLPYHLYWSDQRYKLHRLLLDNRSVGMTLQAFVTRQIYQSWRCNGIRHEQGKEKAQIFACTMCQTRPGRMGFLRGDSCMFCGGPTFGKSEPTHTCMQHAVVNTNFKKCYYCQQIDMRAKPAMLCQMCNMSGKNRCCMPVFDTDNLFHMQSRATFKPSNIFF